MKRNFKESDHGFVEGALTVRVGLRETKKYPILATKDAFH
jgi:hypothetical protein